MGEKAWDEQHFHQKRNRDTEESTCSLPHNEYHICICREMSEAQFPDVERNRAEAKFFLKLARVQASRAQWVIGCASTETVGHFKGEVPLGEHPLTFWRLVFGKGLSEVFDKGTLLEVTPRRIDQALRGLATYKATSPYFVTYCKRKQ